MSSEKSNTFYYLPQHYINALSIVKLSTPFDKDHTRISYIYIQIYIICIYIHTYTCIYTYIYIYIYIYYTYI